MESSTHANHAAGQASLFGGAPMLARAAVAFWVMALAWTPAWAAEKKQKAAAPAPAGPEIVIENDALRAVLGGDGVWRSLTDRASGRQLIPTGVRVAFATATFEENAAVQGAGSDIIVTVQQKLIAAAAARAKSRQAARARMQDGMLTIGFDATPACEVTYRVTIEPDAIIFTIASIKGARPREMDCVRLGVAPRAHTGTRLGAAWDEELAVGLAAANLQTIASARRAGDHILLAAATQDAPGPRLEGAAAVLAAAPPAQFRAILARIAARCPELPRNEQQGVPSRELAIARASYWFLTFGEGEVEQVIDACRQSGIRQVMLSSRAWCDSPGHYLFNTKLYPEGQASLRRAVARLHEAGILVGMHCFASKVAKIDPYVSPAPDKRFWADRTAALADEVGAAEKTIRTRSDLREWPGSPVATQRVWEGGVAKHQEVVIDDEIIQYGSIGPEGRWDAFQDCKRGAWKTQAAPHTAGATGRHYAVDGTINGYIIDQETTLLGEALGRLAGIFNDCGFDMVYFDGGEDVDRRRFTYYVSKFQAEAMRRFTKRPLIHMGTIMTHPLWHSFSRSGTVDTYMSTLNGARIAGVKLDHLPTVREHIDTSVKYMLSVREDMMPGELGWFGIWPKGKDTDGLQLDEAEYLMAKSLAYDAPISLQTSFSQMKSHPLTPGALEIVRVYEGLRMAGAVSEAVRETMRARGGEFALARAGKAWRVVELGPVAKTAEGLRFSVGELDGGAVAILWGAEKEVEAALALPRAGVRAEMMEGAAVEVGGDEKTTTLRVGPHRVTLFVAGLTKQEVQKRLEGK